MLAGESKFTATVVLLVGIGGMFTAGKLSAAGSESVRAVPETLWADLASDDQVKVTHAILLLSAADPRESVAFLKSRLRPVNADPKRTAALIADLDSAHFPQRQQAAAALEYLGGYAIPCLRRALADNPSLEKSRRIEQLLEQMTHKETRLRNDREQLAKELKRAQSRLAAAKQTEAEVRKLLTDHAKDGVSRERVKQQLTMLDLLDVQRKRAEIIEKLVERVEEEERKRSDMTDKREGIDIVQSTPAPAVWLRAVRAIAVLERIATPEARQLIEVMSRGEAEALPTKEARAA